MRRMIVTIAGACLAWQGAAVAQQALFSPLPGPSEAATAVPAMLSSLRPVIVGTPARVRVDMAVGKDVREIRLPVAADLTIDAVVDESRAVCLAVLPPHRDPSRLKGTPVTKCDALTLWKGHARERPAGPDNSIIIISGAGKIAYVRVANGARSFRVQSVPGGDALLYEVDTRKSIMAQNDRRSDAVPLPEEALKQVRQAQEKLAKSGPASPHASQVIKVMVGFTQRAWDTVGGLNYANAAAESWIAEANVGLSYSGATFQYELVNAFNSGAPEQASLQTDINDIEAGRGEYHTVAAVRAYLRADLVALMRTQQADYCGVGSMPASFTTAFSVTAMDCANGGLAFAHELGHNMSADHDPPNAKGSYRPYSKGYGLPGIARTVMAYDFPCACVQYNIWSTPSRTFPGGQPAGNAMESDNVRAMSEYAPIVAGFYP